MANSTVRHSNDIDSTYREREREKGEREKERETERGRRRTTGLLVGFWLIEYREELPRGPASGGRPPVPTVAGPCGRELPDSGGALPRARG